MEHNFLTEVVTAPSGRNIGNMNDPARIISRIILRLAKLLPFDQLSRSVDPPLIAPFYHAISDAPLPHIRHLYRVKNISAFERDLDFLLKYYHPIDFHELPNILLKSKPRQNGKIPMLLSFDDGLREFYDPIAPILLRKGIPAICFLNSAFVDNVDLFFRYKASLLLDTLGAQERLEKQKNILSIGYSDREQLNTIAMETGVDFNDFLRKNQPYLTSVQIESLLRQGFHFGAHSVDHPEYRFLSLDEQLRQTTKSTETISNKFGLGYRLFSFPFTDFGVAKRFFEILLTEKKIAEFSFGCAGIKTDFHARHIQRIPMEANNLTAEEILRHAFLYFWLKKPFGGNHIIRS